MATIKLEKSGNSFRGKLNTNEIYTLILDTNDKIECKEFEDLFFHTEISALRPWLHERSPVYGSSNTEPEAPTSIVQEMLDILGYLENNPGKRIFITGHTDTTGAPEYNFNLSKWRAVAALSLLSENREDFITASRGPHFSSQEKRDTVNEKIHREILAWVSLEYNWGCDPVNFPTTSHATLEFQKKYNKNGKGGNTSAPDLATNAIFDKPTWGAVFDCYNGKIAEKLGKTWDELTAYRNTLKVHFDFINQSKDQSAYFYQGFPSTGCGESHPLEENGRDNYRSQANRRIEVLFIPQEKTIELPCQSGQCQPDICPLNDDSMIINPIPGAGGSSPASTNDTGIFYMQIYNGTSDSVLAARVYTIAALGSSTPLYSGVLDDWGILRHEDVPYGDYTLNVAGCKESTGITVLNKFADHPQVRCLENNSLSFLVETPDGVPVIDAQIEVTGLSNMITDEDGFADFGDVPEGNYDFTILKDGYEPLLPDTRDGLTGGSGSSDDKITGNVTVKNKRSTGYGQLKAKSGTSGTTSQVTKIEANIQGTKGYKDPSMRVKRLNKNSTTPEDSTSLPSSTTNDKALVAAGGVNPGHPPVVLIRGGGVIELQAKTTPDNTPVEWSIEKNQNPNYVTPALTDMGNNRAEVKTDQIGSFSVIAKIKNGSDQKVWNFILVAVQVDVAASKVEIKNDFKDVHERYPGKVPSGRDGASSGIFPNPTTNWVTKEHAWSAEVHVNLIGGGSSYDLGVDKVTVGYLQNMTYCDNMAHYDDDAKATRTFNGPYLDAPEGLFNAPQPCPVVDNNGKMQCPLIFSRSMRRQDISVIGVKLHFYFGDSPAVGWNTHVTNNSGTQKLTKLSGYEKYRAGIVSYSHDASNLVVAHAEASWLADYTGIFTYQSASADPFKYDPGSSAHMTKVDNAWVLLWKDQNGRDCRLEKFELFPPLTIDWANGPQQTTF